MESIAAPTVIQRADGVTDAERKLKLLCDRSFLSLWSYSGIYRDQGDTLRGGDGKEVCDLLVVFEDHIIIFSDKDCVFPNSGDTKRDWVRWFKRAVLKSAEQVWGANAGSNQTPIAYSWIAIANSHSQLTFQIRRVPSFIVSSLPTIGLGDVDRSLAVAAPWWFSQALLVLLTTQTLYYRSLSGRLIPPRDMCMSSMT